METELMEEVVEVVTSEKCPLRLALGVVAVVAVTGATVVAVRKLKQKKTILEVERDYETDSEVEVEIIEED